jgi:hypothetical protein
LHRACAISSCCRAADGTDGRLRQNGQPVGDRWPTLTGVARNKVLESEKGWSLLTRQAKEALHHRSDKAEKNKGRTSAPWIEMKADAAQLQPLVLPQVLHFSQVPLRTMVKFWHSPHMLPV